MSRGPTQVHPNANRPAANTSLEEWLTPSRFAGLLLLFFLISFAEVIAGVETFVLGDFSMFGYPLTHHTRESLWRGEIPLWNPLNYCGIPHLAQWNTMVLYPPTLFLFLFPLSWSLGVFCLLHAYAGGLGTCLLARRWTGGNLGAALAGVLFAFNGLVQNSLMWPNNIAALGCFPWVLLTVERAWCRGGRWLAGGALVGALQMLTGAPELILLTWSVALLVCLTTPPPSGRSEPEPPARLRRLLRFGVVAGLVSLIAAAQLLPFLDLLGQSHRSTAAIGTEWSLPPSGWLNLIVPLYHGTITDWGVLYLDGQSWTHSYYCGALALALALLGAWRAGTGRPRWLLAAGALALLAAIGEAGGIYQLLARILPLGLLRFPVKFAAVLTLVLPLLAAWGTRVILENADRRSGRIWTGVVAGVTGIALYAMWRQQGVEYRPTWLIAPAPAVANGVVRMIFFGLTLTLLWLLQKNLRSGGHRWIGVGLLGLTWLDLRTHQPALTPTTPGELYHSRVEGIQDLQPPARGTGRAMLTRSAEFGLFRAVTIEPAKLLPLFRQTGVANVNLLESLPVTGGFLSLQLRWQDEFDRLLLPGNDDWSPPLARFAGVTHVLTSTNELVWQATGTALPLITAGQAPVVLPAHQGTALLKSPEFDPRTTVVVAADPARRFHAQATSRAVITAMRWADQQVEFEVETPVPAMAVVAQAYYPAWQASVNGRNSELLRANHAFQGVEVPAGRSRVVLRYVDHTFRVGLGLSVVGLLLCGWIGRPGRKSAGTLPQDAIRSTG